MTTAIYAIRNLVNDKRYIGSAVNVDNRWAVHKLALRRGRHHSAKLQNAWNKYGETLLAFEIVEEVRPADLIVREQHYLDALRPFDRRAGYNIGKIAGSPRGTKRTYEQRKAISVRRKGVKFTAEHCAKISAALKGRRPSEAAIIATVLRCKGRPLAAEHRAKIRASSGGWHHTDEAKRRISIARQKVSSR